MKKQILIVEDEPEIRECAGLALIKAGYKVTQAGDGEEALDFIGENGPFDLIVTDLHMPVMGGFELIDTLIGMGSKTPVLVISGFLEEVIISKLQPLDGSDILCKPFTLQELAKKVESILARMAQPAKTIVVGGASAFQTRECVERLLSMSPSLNI